MIKTLIFDLSYTLLYKKDPGPGSMNKLHDQVSQEDNFDFFDYFTYSETFFNLLHKLKKKYQMFVFTSGDLQEDPAIKPILDSIFSKIYSAQYLNIKKTNPDAYKSILNENNLNPSETLFFDDLSDNVAAATQVGMQTYRHNDQDDLENFLSTLI